MRHRVTVWGEQFEVDTYQSSKTVWHAVGTYMGQVITTKDRTASTAVKRWREAAHSRGS